MKRRFNTEGHCSPQKHYMVRLDERLHTIKERYVDWGSYFVINRGRQYGKTTTLCLLAEYLKADYCVLAMDSNDECRLAFGVFRDGVFVGEEISLAQKHRHTITIEEDGRYDFTAMYYSAGTSSFTNCRVEVVTTP